MMESLRAWLLSLAGAALLTALAAMFPTSESLRRVVKLIGGVALTCLLFSPLVAFDYDSYAAALSVCRLDYGSWELYTAPCGLAQLVRRPEEIYTDTDTEHVYIQLILSSDDAPLYFNYQNDLGQGDALADDAVAQYCALLGLDEFADWQYPDWGTAVRDFGAAGYSETAQVYAVANASGYSVTLSAASMTPQTFAALNTQYGEEIS